MKRIQHACAAEWAKSNIDMIHNKQQNVVYSIHKKQTLSKYDLESITHYSTIFSVYQINYPYLYNTTLE